MSSDAKEAKTYNGDKKEDWKAFYDEAVRICRQELGSAGVEWFNGEVEKITAQNRQNRGARFRRNRSTWTCVSTSCDRR